MIFSKGRIIGSYVIELDRYSDERGFFMETYQKKKYVEKGVCVNFVQDNRSSSKRNILRGLHYQRDNPIGQLISVIRGKIFDVGVDLRPNSSTFGLSMSIVLSEENKSQVYLPPGVAHGFYAMDEINEISYKCTDYYYPDQEFGVNWQDPAFDIEWPSNNPILKARDRKFPLLKDISKNDLPKEQ